MASLELPANQRFSWGTMPSELCHVQVAACFHIIEIKVLFFRSGFIAIEQDIHRFGRKILHGNIHFEFMFLRELLHLFEDGVSLSSPNGAMTAFIDAELRIGYDSVHTNLVDYPKSFTGGAGAVRTVE